MKKKLKTLKDFETFFTAIPTNRWCTDTFDDNYGRHCAVGHLMVGRTGNPSALSKMLGLKTVAALMALNDGYPFIVNRGVVRKETPRAHSSRYPYRSCRP